LRRRKKAKRSVSGLEPNVNGTRRGMLRTAAAAFLDLTAANALNATT